MNVRWGTLVGAVFSLLFVVVYAWGDYPLIMVWVNAASLAMILAITPLVLRGRTHRLLAHIIILATYNSMLIPVLYTGGLASSSTTWLLVIPLLAMMITGRNGGIFWGAVSLLTSLGLYRWDGYLSASTLLPVRQTARVPDLVTALLVVILAMWISETTRYEALTQLEATRSQLQRLATTDPLTQVYNRRYFTSRAMQVLKDSRQAALLLFDIDHFKTVNDRFGHEAGDLVLQILCRRVTHNLRADDIFARLSGEEFVILLPSTNRETALSVAERIRRQIAQEPFDIGKLELHVTVSIGVAPLEGTAQSERELSVLLREADHAMYDAKRHGRNRVELYPGTKSPPETPAHEKTFLLRRDFPLPR